MASTIPDLADLQIPLKKILDATNNFSDKRIIGKGGFGNVYRGKMEHCGKMIKIAARRLDRRYGLGDVEFWKEVSALSRLRKIDDYHTVNMIGFCDEKDEKIIITQRYPRGSLEMHISDPAFTWKERFKVANGLFFGIFSMHYELENEYIIHRNINSSTILIDDEGSPRISGYEFSIKIPVDQRKRVILGKAIGTKGYIDPSIEKYGGVTEKSDIYALGVVLFELLCGRKALEENVLLAPLAKYHYENGTLKDIVHPDLLDQIMNQLFAPHQFKILSELAYSCLNEDPTERPHAEELIQQLEVTRSDYSEDSEDEDQRSTDMLDKSSSDHWKDVKKVLLQEYYYNAPEKLEKLEHFRIELTDIYDSPYTRYSKDSGGGLLKKEIEFYDREDVSFVEQKNNDKLPKICRTVAVRTGKKYDLTSFLREIDILGSCKHPNIQSFLGFSYQDYTMMLFYEYVSLEYLDQYWEDSPLGQIIVLPNLTWGKRLKICIDIAHGLDYLHNGMEDQKMVIHGDIRSRNIELDGTFGAKIVNFGNSVIMNSNQSDGSFPLRYYMDSNTGKVKVESDVFSFGVVMLEILCGKAGHNLKVYDDANREEWRWPEKEEIKMMLATSIKEENYGSNLFITKGPNKDSLDTFINITYRCLAETQNQRPNMKVVIEELHKALSFQENHKEPLRMSFGDIKSATQNFDPANRIGGGGFGLVYKGKLEHEKVNGRSTIVVKKLDKSQGQGEKQYYNELQILQEYNHENVIGIIGYSDETNEKLIVYEHASKGSLDKHLNNVSLSWRNRLKISIDVVTGLNFLHVGNQGQGVVIHRDIKTANILLFDDWRAKLGDFGLSLISTIDKKTNFTIDHPCGTMDYVDPIYLQSGILTVESDVYSFGVALFEILCGRETYKLPKHKSQSLLSFIKQKFEDGKQDEVVFKAIKEEIVPKSLTTFINVVYKCLDDIREKRPTTKEILAELEKALEFQDEGKL